MVAVSGRCSDPPPELEKQIILQKERASWECDVQADWLFVGNYPLLTV